MNKISLDFNKSIFPIYESPYQEIKIDDEFSVSVISNSILDKENSEWIKGLVPSYSGWLVNEDEEKYVFQHLTPQNKSFCPILICPDDQDFSCSVLLVEIIRKEKTIQWKRLGWAKGYNYPDINFIDSEVEWILNDFNKEFNLEEYENTIKEIKVGNLQK